MRRGSARSVGLRSGRSEKRSSRCSQSTAPRSRVRTPRTRETDSSGSLALAGAGVARAALGAVRVAGALDAGVTRRVADWRRVVAITVVDALYAGMRSDEAGAPGIGVAVAVPGAFDAQVSLRVALRRRGSVGAVTVSGALDADVVRGEAHRRCGGVLAVA